MRLSYACYGLLLGGISKQAIHQSIQKNEDVHSWFERRLKEYLVPPALIISPSWTKQLAIDTARSNMERLLNQMIHYISKHKINKGTRGPKSWTPQMVANTLGVHIEGKYDVIDVYERYLNRCIDQLIKVNHLTEWLPALSPTPSLSTSIALSSRESVPDTPFEDPFFGAYDR
jgi:hypothetical protein